MLHVVDFRTAALDSGEPESAAIQPYNDGETADQTVFRRPTENNRARIDTLRSLVREHIMLKDYSDGGYILSGGGTVTPATGGGGELTFAITADLYVLPFATPGGGVSVPYLASSRASLSVGTPSTDEIVFTAVKSQFEGASFPAADGNKISVEILHTGAGPTVTVEGATGEVNNIKIEINSTVTNIAAVISAVAGHGVASTLVEAAAGSGTLPTAACPLWGPTEWTEYSDRFLRGGAPGLAHVITNGGLTTFFGTAANELEKGDTLAINYDKVVNTATTGGRLQSTPENTNLNVDGALFNTRVNPEMIPNCIPVCKRVDATTLVFVNGATLVLGLPGNVVTGTSLTLTTPLTGWTRLNEAGLGHDPPTTIREALDNTDEQLATVMTEVETARTSTLFPLAAPGAYASVDARLEAIEGASRAVVTCTDGSASTGGMYNGTSALEDALGALEAAGIGGTVYLRSGTYELTSATTLTHPVRIIGVEEGVVISNEATTGYMLIFDTNGATGESLLENVTLTDGASSSGNMVYLNTGATRTTLRSTVCDGRIHALAVLNWEQSSLNVADGTQGLSCGANAQVVARDITITCNPYTSAYPVVALFLGDNHSFENVNIEVVNTGNVLATIFGITVPTFTVRGLFVNVNDQPLRFGTAESPLIFRATQGAVEDLRIVNAGQIPTVGEDGTRLTETVPYINLAGVATSSVAGQIELRNATISGFSDGAAPSGLAGLCVIGDESAAELGQPATAGGRQLLENVSVDLSGWVTLAATDKMAVFSNIQTDSVFRGCRVELGTTGRVYRGWHLVDISNVKIENCSFSGTSAGTCEYVIQCEGTGGGTSCSGNVIHGNTVVINNTSTTGGAMVGFTSASSAVLRNIVTSNTLRNLGAALGFNCIDIPAGVTYTVVMSNSADVGGATFLNATGANTLYQTVAADSYNVAY